MMKAVVIVGPTASGKTALSVELAKKYGFEIICADSMQIYTQLSIATARPTKDEQANIPHLLFGSVPVSREYSAADYCVDALNAAKQTEANGKRIMFCGGTGLYIDSLMNGVDFSVSASDESVRKRLLDEYNTHGADYMYEKLLKVDKPSAEKIHKNNIKRVIRALEIFELSGEPKSVTDKRASSTKSEFEPLYIGVNYRDRQQLYSRIERRVDNMLTSGLVDEVREFYSLNPCKTAAAAIGCKEIKPFIDGEKSLDECCDDLKTATRRYAKRQLTWFKRNQNINWIYPDEQGFENCFKTASELIEKFYAGDV